MNIIIEPIMVTVDFGDADEFSCSFREEDNFDVDFGMTVPQSEYPGPYVATPTTETQVFQTANQTLAQNFTVNPIPSNYGLITWDGSSLTVS